MKIEGKGLSSLLGLSIAALMLGACSEQAAQPVTQNPAVADGGQIQLPEADFQKDWEFLGAWTTSGDEGVNGQHVVYASPGTIAAYRATGKFPDGAVIIKELLGTEAGTLTTGNVDWATKPAGWFVMVKDAENAYPGNPLWGDGWGWGYFEAKDPGKLVTTNYVDECKACHEPAEETDGIYTQAYPVLKK